MSDVPDRPDARARLPSLTRLLGEDAIRDAVRTAGRAVVVDALRHAIGGARETATARGDVATPDGIIQAALTAVSRRAQRGLRPVVNATGVLLHTNLGRAPLSPAAVDAVVAAAGPTNLEVDLTSGERGGRAALADHALARLTGADAAMVVNNGAAALVLALTVIGRGREIVISRGELVEIGGSFRIPDIIEAAGCILREVGTTNRTHVEDYRTAITDATGAVLRVHTSNYRIEGFVHQPSSTELASVAHAGGVPFVDDIGSGLLTAQPAAPGEPTAAAAIAAGADLVLFSGDKLLGGPQAGILAGRAEFVERCRRHPLARALRIDKLRLAALEATLGSYERGDIDSELPLWRMAAATPAHLQERARRVAERCGGTAVRTDAVLGGGSAPGTHLESWGVALAGPADDVARRLRDGDPAVVCRIVDEQVVADLRSVPSERDDDLAAALRRVVLAGPDRP